MNTEQQKITIAEACGFKKEVGCTGIIRWRDTEGLIDRLPDYLNDLNAMAAAESIIIKAGAQTIRLYEDALQKFVANIVFATAALRAEAFLKTLNLWKL
jgi:hypothetical protein